MEMTFQEGLIKALFVAMLAVLAWIFQTQLATNFNHESRITIMEASKADKEVVADIRTTLETQTVILQNQAKLLEKQSEILGSMSEYN